MMNELLRLARSGGGALFFAGLICGEVVGRAQAPAADSLSIDWLSTQGMAQPASTGQAAGYVLGGATQGRVLFSSNQALLAKLLIKTQDLLGAQPELTIVASDPPLGPQTPGSLNLYAVQNAAETPSRDELLLTMPLKDLSTAGPIQLPDISERLKAALGAKQPALTLLLTLQGTSGQIRIAAAERAKPQLDLKIVAYPPVHLFTVPVLPKPGVYTHIVDGHLNYDGQRLRLWGVVGHPDVDRLVDMGFNAERVWGPLGDLGPGKLYSEESAKEGVLQPSTKGDGSELDLADQHFAELKSHGVFVMLAALTQTIPYEPLYQDGSFVSGGNDWAQWKEAMQTTNAGKPYHYIFVDERLQKIKMQHAKNLLTHVNPYTGKAYGEEENFAIYEIYNENAFVFNILSGELKKWPAYFRDKMQKRWNEWLAAHYANDGALKAAWGKLDDGESLGAVSVKPGPDFEDRLKYPQARADDYVHFIIDLENDYNQRFHSYCRSLFPDGVGVNVAPFSFDTMFRPNLPWAYADCLGDVFSYGMYYWALTSSLDEPPASYLIDSFTVQDKPSVLYETNIGRPNPFRSEYPIKVAALASFQDWDGVFFHYWKEVDSGQLPYLSQKILPPMPTFYWTAVENQTDPVMGTSMALAGRIFLGGYIPPAVSPKLIDVGRSSIFSYSAFRGVNLGRTTFSQGSRIRFSPDNATLKNNDLVPVATRLEHAVAMGKDVVWDWQKGRLIIDAPNIKAYVGRTDGFFRFSDGITLGHVSAPWAAFVLESADGKPLLGSPPPSRILLGAVADAKNSGFSFDYHVVGGPQEQAKAVHNVGHPPVVVDRVEYDVWFPHQFNGTLKSYDFAQREIQSVQIANGNELSQRGETPFLDSLQVDSWGADGALPVAQATRIDTSSPGSVVAQDQAPSGGTTPALADLIQPIPGLDWKMNYIAAHRCIENSPLAYTTFSKFDASAGPDKTITVSDLQLNSFWDNAVDAVISFHDAGMTGIELTLQEPPPVEELVARFSAWIGPPAAKKIDAQYGTTRIFWKGTAQNPDVTVTESQGILKILFQPQAGAPVK